MHYITLSSKSFMKTPIPGHKVINPSFCIKLSEFIRYRYKIHCTETKLFTKKKIPFLVGVNGSVSSGKSYLVSDIATHLNSCKIKTSILSTDNFIFPNKKLNKRKIMDKKGFPESYDTSKLLQILKSLKCGTMVNIPLYDQSISDISDEKLKITGDNDIIIVEGINILQPDAYLNCSCVQISNYLDYSIYIDAPEKHLKYWFLKRLLKKKKEWGKMGIKKDITKKNQTQFKKWTMDIWSKVNGVNLKKYILPFKEHADLILLKNKDHTFKSVAIKM